MSKKQGTSAAAAAAAVADNFLEKMICNEEEEYTAPNSLSGSYLGRSKDDEIFFQASNGDTNFSEHGMVNAVKLKHRAVWNFDSGYFFLRSVSSKRTVRTTGNFHEFIILMDAQTAATAFENPVAMAQQLTKCGYRLVSKWNQKNGDASMKGKRAPVAFTYELGQKEWMSQTRGKETTSLKLIISSFSITNEVQQSGAVEISPTDLVAQVKMKSTAFRTGGAKKEALFDAWGFQAPWPAFLGLLRSHSFGNVVEHAIALAALHKEGDAGLDEEEEVEEEEGGAEEEEEGGEKEEGNKEKGEGSAEEEEKKKKQQREEGKNAVGGEKEGEAAAGESADGGAPSSGAKRQGDAANRAPASKRGRKEAK